MADRVPYEARLTDTALAAHRLAEGGADEPDLDTESLDRALSDGYPGGFPSDRMVEQYYRRGDEGGRR